MQSLFVSITLTGMKKILLLTIVVGAISLTSCAQKTNEKKIVKAVAYEYEQALANYDLDQAEKFASSETKARFIPKARAMVKKVGREVIEADMPAKVKISDIEISSDTTATVKWKKKTPRSRSNGTLELRKRDGVWQALDLIQQMPQRQ